MEKLIKKAQYYLGEIIADMPYEHLHVNNLLEEAIDALTDLKNEMDEEDVIHEEIDKITNKISKLIKDYPELQRRFEDEKDSYLTIANLKEYLLVYKKYVKLLDEINPDTKVFKIFSNIKEIYEEEYGDQYTSSQLKDFAKLLKEDYKISTLKDMINTPRVIWDNIFDNTYEIKILLMEIASTLYPKYKFDIDADINMAGIAFFVRYPNDNFEEVKGEFKSSEKQDFFNELYHGHKIPKAPPSPFNCDAYWEQEFEEYRPRRRERIK